MLFDGRCCKSNGSLCCPNVRSISLTLAQKVHARLNLIRRLSCMHCCATAYWDTILEACFHKAEHWSCQCLAIAETWLTKFQRASQLCFMSLCAMHATWSCIGNLAYCTIGQLVMTTELGTVYSLANATSTGFQAVLRQCVWSRTCQFTSWICAAHCWQLQPPIHRMLWQTPSSLHVTARIHCRCWSQESACHHWDCLGGISAKPAAWLPTKRCKRLRSFCRTQSLVLN